jgi:PPOX class probable F420-dependent enzyme
MSRRDQIQMTESERQAFVRAAHTIILCSLSKEGFPHPMPMWFGVEDDGTVVMTTFAKSQKIRNLERDSRVSLLVESGEEYAELRGVVMYGRAELRSDLDSVLDVLARVTARSHAARDADPAALREALAKTAGKRVAIRVRPERIVSWDHTKLGGVY